MQSSTSLETIGVSRYSSHSVHRDWVIAQNSLKSLKDKIDPRGNNGGFFLGLNGLVVKSHGGTDFIGFSNAIQFSVNLARSDISKKISDLIEENI